MIDSISITFPYDWKEPIHDGYRVDLREDGSVRFAVAKTKWIEGSYDDKISVRSLNVGWVQVQGSFAKFLQGHNLFGTDNVLEIVKGALDFLFPAIGLEWSESLWAFAVSGMQISRIDFNYMFACGSNSNVSLWIRAASETGAMKYRTRGIYRDGTLYFGLARKGATATGWTLKIYNKKQELSVHPISGRLPLRDRLLEWVDDKLRVELTLRTRELRRISGIMGLEGDAVQASWWTPEKVALVWSAYFAKLQLPEEHSVEREMYEGLKPAVRCALVAWENGEDLKSVLSKSTFDRYRKQILDASGVDILVLSSKTLNVVPLRRFVQALPAPVPDWAEPVFFRSVA